MNKNALGLLLLRIGLGEVFLWFGVDKFFHPFPWSQYIPPWFTSLLPMKAFTFIYLMGVFESIVGLLVLLGLFTRLASVLSALLLLGIIGSLGYNEIMVRDAGLFFLALGISMLGAGEWSLDQKMRKV